MPASVSATASNSRDPLPALAASGLPITPEAERAPMARLCHPPRAEEHLLPLMLVAGAAGQSQGVRVFSDRVMETTLSAYRFG